MNSTPGPTQTRPARPLWQTVDPPDPGPVNGTLGATHTVPARPGKPWILKTRIR
ncbi:MAG TPA: hypothetical protein VF391_01585 [Dermatophilaceae bacterium]